MSEEDIEVEARFIDLLVWVRAQVRDVKQWALADEIRHRMAKLGIVLEDGHTQTTWKRT